MKILIVTDAWYPQVNGVCRTLKNLGDELKKIGHQVEYIEPNQFFTVPMPKYNEIKITDEWKNITYPCFKVETMSGNWLSDYSRNFYIAIFFRNIRMVPVSISLW